MGQKNLKPHDCSPPSSLNFWGFFCPTMWLAVEPFYFKKRWKSGARFEWHEPYSSTRMSLRPCSRRNAHPPANQPSYSLLTINGQYEILQISRTLALNSNHWPAPALSVIESMKRGLTWGYKTGIMEGINSLSILCSAQETRRRKQPHLESILHFPELNYWSAKLWPILHIFPALPRTDGWSQETRSRREQ